MPESLDESEDIKLIHEQMDRSIEELMQYLTASSIVVIATIVGQNSKSTFAYRHAGNIFAAQKSLEIACDDLADFISIGGNRKEVDPEED